MPLFYHKYVNYVLAHSVNYVITLYRLAPPVAPTLSIPTTILKEHPSFALHHHPCLFMNALLALRPAKPLGVLSRHPCRNPKPLPRGEGLCMLCWLCIVQSLWAYTPGIHAGAECGAAALTPLGATPKARMLWLLAKSFARCKTGRASNAKHPF